MSRGDTIEAVRLRHVHSTTASLTPATAPSPLPVVITLPSYSGFAASSLHDVEVRLGSTPPTATLSPSATNTLCAATSGVLSSAAGTEVRLACAGAPIDARIVTVQIRWAAVASAWHVALCVRPGAWPGQHHVFGRPQKERACSA